jgi:outer membrane protein assembly factor BamE (lipoprotein component of BamABCDE complex)
MTAWVRIGIALGVVLLATGCVSIRGQRGYLADEVLMQSVQPGVDNRQSVERTLGRPSFVGQFGEPVWYYVSSVTGQKPFRKPTINGHTVLAVHFDAADQVVDVERTGLEQVARIDPENDETPTLGRERSFFQDLFGNIGQVGAGGAAAGGGGGG